MAQKLAEIISMEEVRKKNLCKMICEHNMLNFGGNVYDFFKRFGTQIELIHSKLDSEFDYLSNRTKGIINRIYRQYECVVKGVK
ncbi:MAG: hypothetical protein KKA65_00025 [Nanoarchaeota archaeon]|nr:hypothetical protein [Nanoarchaeota archaeon]MBU4241648.1 hypothetical protein [Nanoarchaeota archaeon]MBU4352362.1 hypothetical protein [Nanoarchaeota archaeon]MBU4455873.1 hypothetical protein [Nanoarchaeota archaeon]MCG2719494.1 hypothetical protein [Nanoarchaeota archaeon]